jgi:hypothetical protein
MENRLSPEFELVCACARVVASADGVAHSAGRISAEGDWDEVLRLAEHHSVLPLVARNLAHRGDYVPEEIKVRLSKAYETNVRRNLWFAAELGRIADHLEREDVQAVPLKGAVLAESVYGDLALRTYNDLDFLIAPEDLAPARRALEGIGYKPSKPLSPAEERMALRTGYELSLSGEAGPNLVELQWRVLPYFCGVDLKSNDLIARSVPVGLSGRQLRGLAPEYLFIVLCLHAAKHLWMRLLWIVDISETLRTQTIDWEVVRSRSKELGIARMIGVSLCLAKDVLNTAIPERAQPFIGGDAAIPTLSQQFTARLASCVSYDFESLDYFQLSMKTRERSRDQARYLWRLVWSPGPGEAQAISLPRQLFPLYRMVRIGRLLRKFS